jgi:broad specificity phosphatase PhoE
VVVVELLILRHGQTEWTTTGQHTGTTDIELNENGGNEARRQIPVLRGLLNSRSPTVYSSPLLRATRTAELALPGMLIQAEPLIREFDYGEYEGLTARAIDAIVPGWNIWRDGCPGGESTTEVSARADEFLERRVFNAEEPVIAVSHGHFSRILAVRALGRPAMDAELLSISTGSISVLKTDSGRVRLSLWNRTTELAE